MQEAQKRGRNGQKAVHAIDQFTIYEVYTIYAVCPIAKRIHVLSKHSNTQWCKFERQTLPT